MEGDRDRRAAVARAVATAEEKRTKGKGGKNRKVQKLGEKSRSRERATGEGILGQGRELWGSRCLSRSHGDGDNYGDGGIVLPLPAYLLS